MHLDYLSLRGGTLGRIVCLLITPRLTGKFKTYSSDAQRWVYELIKSKQQKFHSRRRFALSRYVGLNLSTIGRGSSSVGRDARA